MDSGKAKRTKRTPQGFAAEFEKLLTAEIEKKFKRRSAAAKKAARTRKERLRSVSAAEVAEWLELFENAYSDSEKGLFQEDKAPGADVRQPETSNDQDVIANTARLITFEGLPVILTTGPDSVNLKDSPENFLSFQKMAGEIIYDYHREAERMKDKGKLALSPMTIWITRFTGRKPEIVNAVIDLRELILSGFGPDDREKFDVNFYYYKHF